MTSPWRDRILWIDGAAALSAGVCVLAARRWLAEMYGLPPHLVTIGGGVNLTYAAYSLTLAARERRPVALIGMLATANAIWAAMCLAVAIRFRGEATFIGLIMVLLEGAFVAALAVLEWRSRHVLAGRGPQHRRAHVAR